MVPSPTPTQDTQQAPSLRPELSPPGQPETPENMQNSECSSKRNVPAGASRCCNFIISCPHDSNGFQRTSQQEDYRHLFRVKQRRTRQAGLQAKATAGSG